MQTREPTKHLAVALAAADLATRISIEDWDLALPADSERVIEVLATDLRLLPRVLGIAEEQAVQMALAGSAVRG